MVHRPFGSSPPFLGSATHDGVPFSGRAFRQGSTTSRRRGQRLRTWSGRRKCRRRRRASDICRARGDRASENSVGPQSDGGYQEARRHQRTFSQKGERQGESEEKTKAVDVTLIREIRYLANPEFLVIADKRGGLCWEPARYAARTESGRRHRPSANEPSACELSSLSMKSPQSTTFDIRPECRPGRLRFVNY